MSTGTLGRKANRWSHDYYKWAKERPAIHGPEYNGMTFDILRDCGVTLLMTCCIVLCFSCPSH